MLPGRDNIATTSEDPMRAFAAAVFVIAVLYPISGFARTAEKPISDPKKWCADAVQLIADKNTDELLDFMVASARAPITKDEMAQKMATLPPLLPRTGGFLYTVPIDERIYANSYASYWSLIVYDLSVLFIRCDLIKESAGWGLKGFSYSSDAENIDLP